MSVIVSMGKSEYPVSGETSNKKKFHAFSDDKLKEALLYFSHNNQVSSEELQEKFGMPVRTMFRKVNNEKPKRTSSPKQKLFTLEEELLIVDYFINLRASGFSFSKQDIKQYIRNLVEDSGRPVGQLEDGFPNDRWIFSFIQRHRHVFPEKVKSTEVDMVDVQVFCAELRAALNRVPAKNILNFDETNLCDQTDNEKWLFRRRSGPVTDESDSLSTHTGIMFSGTAAGQALTPYILYKSSSGTDEVQGEASENSKLYFSSSKSGWFDQSSLEDWFYKVIAPWAKSTPGKKIMIGDNVLVHFSKSIQEICQEYNIQLMHLPSTWKCMTQPLEIAFFTPVKMAWRKFVNGSDHKELGQTDVVKSLLTSCTPLNIRSGFEVCGLYPFDEHTLSNQIQVKAPMINQNKSPETNGSEIQAKILSGEEIQNLMIRFLKEKSHFRKRITPAQQRRQIQKARGNGGQRIVIHQKRGPH